MMDYYIVNFKYRASFGVERSKTHKRAGMIVKDYEEIRGNLIEMLEDLNDRLAKITDDVKHSEEPLAKDFEEQATQTENDQVLDYLGNAARKEIAEIKQAIARIDKGEYGICQCCGEPIAKERLRAVPYANLCIKCASQSGC
jgi:RNA polymerase-binding protein DksA